MSHVLMAVIAVAWQAEAPSTPNQPQPPANEARAKRLEYMKQKMAAYRIFTGPKHEKELALNRKPVYRWSRQISDIHDGTTYVWTVDGRPEAVTQIFLMAKPRRRWIHMFASLSEQPLRAELEGKAVWSPATAGVKWRTVPDAPAPAATAVARRRQMRSILETFDASIKWKGEIRYQLREVPQPIYRYGDSRQAVIDGAIFALSEGTNPKLLLLLEAHRGVPDGQWRYGIVPLTVHEAQVSLAGRQVFKVPYRYPRNDPQAALFNLTHFTPEPESESVPSDGRSNESP